MENYEGAGEPLKLTAPSGSPDGVVAGEPVLIGTLLVVPARSAAGGAEFEGTPVGVFLGRKVPTEAWDEGQVVRWDAAASLFTEVVGSPVNRIVGQAARAAAAAVAITTDTAGSPQALQTVDNVITVLDYTGAADKTITLTIARELGDPRVVRLVEGVDFDALTDNATTATAIAAAIGAVLGLSAIASTVVGSPTLEIVTVTVDEPARAYVRLDGAARA